MPPPSNRRPVVSAIQPVALTVYRPYFCGFHAVIAADLRGGTVAGLGDEPLRAEIDDAAVRPEDLHRQFAGAQSHAMFCTASIVSAGNCGSSEYDSRAPPLSYIGRMTSSGIRVRSDIAK